MKPVERRTRGATVKGFLVGFLSGVALTVIIGVSVYFAEDAKHEVIVDALPTPPEPEYLVACNCPTEEDADFLATVNLVYPSWSDVLTNHDSLAFKQLVLHTEEVINNVFRATDISSFFDHCRVTAFRKTGTDRVQAEMRLFFSKDFSATASELVDAFHFGYTTLLQIPSSGDVGTIDSASFTPTSLGHTPLTSSTQPAHTSPGLPKPLPIADGTCGIGHQYPKASSGRIVGGTATEWYGVYPWVVLILRHGRHLCGGTVWDAQHILTTAHCFSGLPHLDDTILVNSSTLEIIAGKWKFSISDTWRYAQRVNVSAAMMHKNYSDQTFENDIGILKLDRPLELNYVVEPICHPTNTTQLPQQGTVAGWGTLQEGTTNFPDKLMEATVKLYSGQDCYRLFASWFDNGNISKYLHDGNFCGANGLRAGIDTCQGDSGGPLFGQVQGESERWTVLGIASNGFGCARVGNPGFYTYVPYYLGWIDESIDRLRSF